MHRLVNVAAGRVPHPAEDHLKKRFGASEPGHREPDHYTRPKSEGLIIASAGQGAAIRAEIQLRDPGSMPAEALEQPADGAGSTAQR